MNKKAITLILLFLVPLWSLTFVDRMGYRVDVNPYPPKRVVALTPALSEAVCLLNCSKLVGTVEPVTYPPELEELVKEGKVKVVGYFWNPNVEAIASLSPDLVLADAGSDLRMRDHLISAGLKVFFVKGGVCESVKCVEEDLVAVGKALGEEEEARKVAGWIEGNLTLAQGVAKLMPVVKYVALFYPYKWGIYAVGENNFISSVADSLNAVNLIKNKGWPRVSEEKLATLRPDVVIVLTSGRPDLGDAVNSTLKLVPEVKWVCVIYAEAADVVERPGPRLSEAPLILLNALHLHLADSRGVYCYSPR
ncbi:helical backbone metal receptor [Ignicoccus hospitalis]|uniref:Periplasmic binding protein n=1 Tax=Ignicoccus hospitalis (strain KIN4/I / DSM 18386 / JCM 14125) TaxID=453591 RepID=A8ABS8_IGNH4|nr:helical backbone metal receptor [Ignicoccus hospitalis]ABU82380.1 periplasmic binding protein [Ignicoccus hospitalis KIN4/I]HIH90855.1 ABC transporter substrate-binding protein [Desulfurococcaceae archaeon]